MSCRAPALNSSVIHTANIRQCRIALHLVVRFGYSSKLNEFIRMLLNQIHRRCDDAILLFGIGILMWFGDIQPFFKSKQST
jgi:hypothetical protein